MQVLPASKHRSICGLTTPHRWGVIHADKRQRDHRSRVAVRTGLARAAMWCEDPPGHRVSAAGQPIPCISAALKVRLEPFQCRNRLVHSARVGWGLIRCRRCMAKSIRKSLEFQTVSNGQWASADRVQKRLNLWEFFMHNIYLVLMNNFFTMHEHHQAF